MLDCALTADVPLGPFEGTPVTVYSAKGKNAKLHAATTCAQLRARDITTAQVPLNAETIGRMCSRCAQWGAWVRPETGLGVFLKELGGIGLLYQLRSHTGPDEDTWWDESEVQAAADLLRTEPAVDPDSEEADGDDEEARDDAEHVRDSVFSAWRDAAKSLHRAQAAAEMFPWLADWAEPKLAVKKEHLETLRVQAARFVDPDGLLTGAAAALLDEPDLPTDDPALTAIGTREEINRGLKALWRDWQRKAEAGWGRPSERSYISYTLTHGMRSNRKGYAQACSAADELVASWEDLARAAAAGAEPAPILLVTAHLSEVADDSSHRYERGFLSELDNWTTGVLVTYLATADWARRTLTLRVPPLIAGRLLDSRASLLDCEPHTTATTETTTGTGAETAVAHIRPGIFDDTPVRDRQSLAADHVRALRAVSAGDDQLYLVFSPDGGPGVLPLAVVERRLAAGWRGTIIAGASDLPASVIEPWIREVGPRPDEDDGESVWPAPVRDPHDPRFGEDLGLADGARITARLRYWRENPEQELRCLAMARGAADLRTLDGGPDRDGRRRTVSSAVWHGLLVSARRLRLQPFEQPGTDRWHGGSGIPLGVLADVQVYTTDADPGWQRKGHSPFCSHSGERGVTEHDDLLRIADLLARDDFDWCSKCDGFAVRRLTDTQLSYYRAAHRLHDVARKLDRDSGTTHPTDWEALAVQLSELSDWHPIGEKYWDAPESWRWSEIIRDLRRRLEAARRQTS
ncbi:hypothetical protein [Kitasatospora sp. NPDC086791]|uniref:hypothetical protein n=1 Tax=Kitasatospora sp. NPDC086791 TaxID=3155178 RepID=UPI00342105B5